MPSSDPRFPSAFAESNGARLHYVRGGSPGGEPVLLWHGFLETWFCWRKVLPLLAQAGFDVVAPDMRGYGDSDKPMTGYDGRALAGDFRALAAHLGWRRPVHLVAHDMGAPPALLWAAEQPEEVATLTYLDEPLITEKTLAMVHQFTPEGTKHGGLWWWPFAFAKDLPETLLAGRERAFLEFSHENYLFDPDSIEEAATGEYLRTFAAPDGVRGAFGCYRAIFETMRQTQEATSSSLELPILALGGEKSMGEHVQEMLATVADDVRGGSVERCGHFIPEEQPEWLVGQLRELFQSAPGR